MTIYRKRPPLFKAFQWNGPETPLPEWLPYTTNSNPGCLRIMVGMDRYDYGVYEQCYLGDYVVFNIRKEKIKIVSENDFNDLYELIP